MTVSLTKSLLWSSKCNFC